MSGYILESRSIIDSEIWKKPPIYFKVWHYLLLKAQYSDNGNLKRGQLFTTINEIADACSYYAGYRRIAPSRKEIWSVLQFLRNPNEGNNERDKKETMIETTKVTHGIVVTICNYCKYQDPKSYEGNNGGNDDFRTKEQRNGQQGNNINNELKNNNNKEKDNTSYSTNTQYYPKRKNDLPLRKQVPPTVEMVKAYCEERHNGIDAEYFCDFYTSKNWMIGKERMKDWQAAVRTWEKRNEPKRTDGKADSKASGVTDKERSSVEEWVRRQRDRNA